MINGENSKGHRFATTEDKRRESEYKNTLFFTILLMLNIYIKILDAEGAKFYAPSGCVQKQNTLSG